MAYSFRRDVRWLVCVLLFGTAVLGWVSVQAQEATRSMLAVVGTDGNLTIYDVDGKNPFSVTTDGKDGERLYSWPTWSTDGRLAFFGASNAQPRPYTLGVFIMNEVKAGATFQTAQTSLDDVFTYAYWSPANCPSSAAADNCRELALLYTPSDSDGKVALKLIRTSKSGFSEKEVGRAAPFYYSFAPDGKQMLLYRNSAELALYDIGGSRVGKTLDDTPGSFAAPMWSPVDDRLMFATMGSKPDTSDLVIVQGDKRTYLLRDQDSPLSFAWSPDASKTASVSGFDQLVVTDVQTGKQLATSPQTGVAAHFWSPQSDRVAYIVITRNQSDSASRLRNNGETVIEQAAVGLKWYILDVKTGQSTPLVTFQPTRDMIYYLNFFDQFSRSHRLWSPDGKYITYGTTTSAGQQYVMVVNTQTVQSTRVGPGTIGIYSWR